MHGRLVFPQENPRPVARPVEKILVEVPRGTPRQRRPHRRRLQPLSDPKVAEISFAGLIPLPQVSRSRFSASLGQLAVANESQRRGPRP
jgi:hypothetical protein